MDVSDLRAFEAVARLGSMNRAAAELNTVQSNVTAKIRNLEFELKTQLFQRSARGVELTPAGRRMLPFPLRLKKLLSDARAAARDDGPPSGRLEIGTLETIAALRLPHVLAGFARSYPTVQISLKTGTTRALVSDVIDGRIDGALVTGAVESIVLNHASMFHEELVLVTSASIHSVDELVSIPNVRAIVFRQGCVYREKLEMLLAARGVSTVATLEFSSLEAILGCIEAGVGLSLLPIGIINRVKRDGLVKVHQLPPEDANVQTAFVRRHDTYLSSAMTAFIELLRDEALTFPNR
ncbi:DNA-binding transcriptional LysR family regulator [Bradyrhizobium sp. USDA 4509]|uniref:LysR substrate-binding domain-containing protein n=1 Tax=Bradyrhizobium brasilense TaxID=1419277 RepID=A0ABY8JLP9_9BRAD|nr:LysR substrate-binding domain-containing protein [Bradyrhizobium brasilense]WFU64908.1 LysR substrate-binding domain-containing protein [Bradyrhizobium brasilense]